MKLFYMILTCIGLCLMVNAETRVWTMADGKSVEAEFLSVIAGNVSLRSLDGKVVKVPISRFSQDDREFIQLSMPPRLELNFSKKSEQRTFPESLSELPRSFYFDFTAKVEQKSTLKYSYPLNMEFFVFAKEKDGEKDILKDYQQATFTMENGHGSTFELKSNKIELAIYSISEETRGEEYSGYLIVITDTRGEIIAHAENSPKYFEHLENLRKVPVGKTIDDECNRTMPTRPKPFYK